MLQDKRVRSIVGQRNFEACKRRIEREVKLLEKLKNTYDRDDDEEDVFDLFGCLTRENGGRITTKYVQLAHDNFLQGLSSPSRHELCGHQYVELDFSGAHLSIIYNKIRAFFHDAARRTCPALTSAATDITTAKQRVVEESGCCLVDAKKLILAALNQQSNKKCEFLSKLCSERIHMLHALQGYVCNSKSPLKNNALSLLLQKFEADAAYAAAKSLRAQGFAVVLFVHDGLFFENSTNASIDNIIQRTQNHVCLVVAAEVRAASENSRARIDVYHISVVLR